MRTCGHRIFQQWPGGQSGHHTRSRHQRRRSSAATAAGPTSPTSCTYAQKLLHLRLCCIFECTLRSSTCQRIFCVKCPCQTHVRSTLHARPCQVLQISSDSTSMFQVLSRIAAGAAQALTAAVLRAAHSQHWRSAAHSGRPVSESKGRTIRRESRRLRRLGARVHCHGGRHWRLATLPRRHAPAQKASLHKQPLPAVPKCTSTV